MLRSHNQVGMDDNIRPSPMNCAEHVHPSLLLSSDFERFSVRLRSTAMRVEVHPVMQRTTTTIATPAFVSASFQSISFALPTDVAVQLALPRSKHALIVFSEDFISRAKHMCNLEELPSVS
jgi:hypothetical protein